MEYGSGARARIAAAVVWSTIFYGASLTVAQAATVAGTTTGQFSVNESGAATYRIPIQVPPGVAGMEPKLELSYHSQGGNGLLGMGWTCCWRTSMGMDLRTWLATAPIRGAEESWDLGGAPYPTVTNVYQYGQSPQYGDPTQISVVNSAGAGKTTVNEYWPVNTGSRNWILGRLKKAGVPGSFLEEDREHEAGLVFNFRGVFPVASEVHR